MHISALILKLKVSMPTIQGSAKCAFSQGKVVDKYVATWFVCGYKSNWWLHARTHTE